jgi:hypothetical protein
MNIPEEIMAHQFLYYVLGSPVITDYEYDRLCKDLGCDGTGGSDRFEDYPIIVREKAMKLLERAAR